MSTILRAIVVSAIGALLLSLSVFLFLLGRQPQPQQTAQTWLFLATWRLDQTPSDYKVLATIGPFSTKKECWAVGVLAADTVQIGDLITETLGACSDHEPALREMKTMRDMACASLGRDDLCWYKDGNFVDKFSYDP